jgi:hypothetical protein
VSLAFGDRLGHQLRLRAGDDRLNRFGNRGRHQSRSGAQRGARGQDRGAGFSPAAGDYDRMAEISLVRINRTRLQKFACVGSLVKSPARRDLSDRAGRKSDLRDLELSAMLRAGIGDVSELRVTEADGERGPHRDAHDRATVGIDSRRDIDRNDRRANRVHPLDRRARNSAHCRVQAGAENPIDDRARPRAERRFEFRFVLRLNDRAARGEQLVMRAPRVALQIAARSEQRDSNLNSALTQPPRRDHRVAAVVALAAYRQNARASRVGKPRDELVGDRLARARHQRVRIDAVFCLAKPIEFPAFSGGQKNHRGKLNRDPSKRAPTPHRATKAHSIISSPAREIPKRHATKLARAVASRSLFE